MEFHKIQVTTGTLSPPYGDCTEAWHDSYKAILLSLPHGDDTMDFYYWGIVNLICETPNTLKNEEVEALI